MSKQLLKLMTAATMILGFENHGLSVEIQAMEQQSACSTKSADTKPVYFGLLTNNFDRREMILNEAEKIGMVAYIIDSKSQVDLENKTITGVSILRHSRIVASTKVFPVPTVMYDYSFTANKAVAVKKRYKALRADLKKLGIPYLNPVAIDALTRDKGKFAKVLEKGNVPHPKTLDGSDESLFSLLQENSIVFAKPTNGSKGAGIIIVTHSDELPGHYDIKYTVTHGDHTYDTMNVNALNDHDLLEAMTKAKIEMKSNGRVYILQEGIKMRPFRGKPCHIRAFSLRGRDGNMVSPQFFGKIGGNRGIGGVYDDYMCIVNFVSKETGIAKDVLVERLNSVALQAHLTLEKEIKEKIVDLGHDLVFNEKGEVLVIETNVKSGQPVVVTKKGVDCSEVNIASSTIGVHLLEKGFVRERSIAHFGLHVGQSLKSK